MESGSREADVWGGYGEEFWRLLCEREGKGRKDETKRKTKGSGETWREGGRANPDPLGQRGRLKGRHFRKAL